MTDLKWHVWSRVVALTKPVFVSPVRWRAAAFLGVLAILLVGVNLLNVANSFVGRNFMTAISRRDHDAYVKFSLLYFGVFTASTIVGVLYQYAQDRLALLWRYWFTQHLIDRYLSGHMFDRIRAKKGIDNPDQRIAEDVRTFTNNLLSFVVMIVNSTLTTFAFAGILWSITPLLFVTAIVYSGVGSIFTVLLGHRLVHLSNLQLKKEADLRYVLIHVREHGDEQPVDTRGQPKEGRRVRARLRRVVANSLAVIRVARNVGFFTSKYNYLVPVLPVMIVAPRYLRAEIEFGVVTQSAMAFAQLVGAFSLILTQFQSLSTFAAVIQRLGVLWEEMVGSADEAVVVETGRGRVPAEGLHRGVPRDRGGPA